MPAALPKPRLALTILGKICAALFIIILIQGLITWLDIVPAKALTAGDLTIAMNTNPLLVVDSNSCATGPQAAYVGFKITNNRGFAIPNLSATLSELNTAGSMVLGSNQPATILVGNIGAGQSKTAYWFINYGATCASTFSSNLTVTLSNQSMGTLSWTGTITTNSSISATPGGKSFPRSWVPRQLS